MIHSVTMQNWKKHHGRTFKFSNGLNLIKGENEGGKSIILEAIDYALHGSVALRLPSSMYPSNLFVCLITTIGHTRYRIERSPSKVELFNDETNETLAKGARPVDSEIQKALGYNRNVFLMANYSCQDQISYLSSMRPAERKKTIDNVVGLTAVEQVIKVHKEELTVLNRMAKSISSYAVEKPVEPEGVRIQNIDEVTDLKRKTIAGFIAEIQAQKTLKENLSRLMQHKPEKIAAPDLSAMIEGLTNQQIIQHRSALRHLKNAEANIVAQLSSDKFVEPELLPEPDCSFIIEHLTEGRIADHEREVKHYAREQARAEIELEEVLKDLAQGTYTEEQITQAVQLEETIDDWLHVQRLKAKGSIVCDDCGSTVHLAKEALAEYAHVLKLEVEPKGPETSSKIMRNVKANFEKATVRQQQLDTELSNLKQRQASMVDSWFTEEAIENHRLTSEKLELYKVSKHKHNVWEDNVAQLKLSQKENTEALKTLLDGFPSDDKVEAHSVAEQKQEVYQRYTDNLIRWTQQYDSLGTYRGDEYIAELNNHMEAEEAEIAQLEVIKNLWAKFDDEVLKYNTWFNDMTQNSEAIYHEKSIVDALTEYKAKIKSAILPSVNAVATTWLKRMSLGVHFKAELTDEMAILINDEPIEALSISGRALGHLSLRMALGQVLTTRVFPVFIADEVDASMRDNRAQNVLNALTDMLNGPVKQLIVISHRELEHEATVIEV